MACCPPSTTDDRFSGRAAGDVNAMPGSGPVRSLADTRGDRTGGAIVDVCLMIEGQEGVTWEQWLALARACEEHGFQALFRSDHYVSFGHPEEWGSLDAWATLTALGA